MKVLVDYLVLKELCDSIKKDKSNFTGRIKSEVRKNASSKKKEIDETKRLLLSKRKNQEKVGKGKSRKRDSSTSTSEIVKKSHTGSKSDSDQSGSSDGSNSESGSESDDSSNSDENESRPWTIWNS